MTTNKNFFDLAIIPVLSHEGGYVNNPADPGGETKYGICKRVYPKLDIKNLTKEQAIEIYRRDYWRDYMDKINDYRIAAKLFDMSVNMGHGQANKIIQRAAGTKDDGVLGPHTLAAINTSNQEDLLENIVAEQLEFYEKLAESKPKLKTFLAGWSHRAKWTPADATATV